MEPIKGIATGHVMYPDERTYEAFKRTLSDIRPAEFGNPDPRAETLRGEHPIYGLVALTRMPVTAARTHAPSFMVIITTDDEALVARARRELDTDKVP